jgi:septum formation protein
VLASASPARLRLLTAAGIDADVVLSGVDESVVEEPAPDKLSLILARLKATAVADRLSAGAATDQLTVDAGVGQRTVITAADQRTADAAADQHTATTAADQRTGDAVADQVMARAAAERRRGRERRTLVLGCDSVLAFEGKALGKPADPDEATQRWRRMRGRHGVLYTGHCLVDLATDRLVEDVAGTTVHFANASDEEIAAYVATGEPLRVAGAFTIDGIGGPFIERIEGDPGTVIGLSLPLLRHLLARLDLPISALWRTKD